jgi:hypothetical protein
VTMSEFEALSERLNNLAGEMSLMRQSLVKCQTRCHVERESRARHVKWTLALLTSVLSAVSAAALTHWLRY